MNPCIAIKVQRILACFTCGLLFLGAVTPQDEAVFNHEFEEFLEAQRLKVEEVVEGMSIPLNSIITTVSPPDRANVETLVTIAFARKDVQPAFLASLLREQRVPGAMPFTERGIEVVLSREHLKLTLHTGVTLHIRSDIPGVANLNRFVSENVAGVVTAVRGKALISRDREIIKKRLSTVWARYQVSGVQCIFGKNCFLEPDGSVRMETVLDEKNLPRFYKPRVEQ